MDHFLNKKYHYEEIGNNNDAEGELKSILRNFHEKKKFADASKIIIIYKIFKYIINFNSRIVESSAYKLRINL